MARKPAKGGRGRAKRKASNGAAPKPQEGATRLISASALKTLLTQYRNLQSKVDTASGELGNLVREYSDKKYLHRGAFNVIKRLHHMEPGKLWLFLCHFDHMREAIGLDNLAEEQTQMLSPGTEEDGDEPDNVVDIGAREVDESAGEAA